MQVRVSVQLVCLLLLTATEIQAQSFIDNALDFSRTRPGGSARMQALGGAQVALGGDFSSALSNPAGLGMYNRSEVTVTPGFNLYGTESTYNGVTEEDSNSKFVIPGLSYVHQSTKNNGDFIGGAFAITITRTNDFNSRFTYTGNDNVSSVVDYFLQQANGTNVNNLNFDLPTGLAYNTYLIDDSTFWGGPNDNYFSIIGLYDDPNDIRRLKRQGTVTTSGAQYQWSFAYGANFNDKIFAGATLGIATLRYKFSSYYRESDFFFELDPDFNPLDYLEVEETIDIQGTGVNLTLGLIYRPTDFLQIGASYVTPTSYQSTDSYFARINTQWNNYNYLGTGTTLNFITDQSQQPLIAEYNLRTPMRFSLGTAFFISNKGFITGDVEFVNYSKARYNSDISGISFDFDNQAIGQLFANTVNYRVGGEFRHESLRIRAGYNLMSNPIDDSIDIDRSIKTLSFGAGYRGQKFFVDFAWLTSQWDSAYAPYAFQDSLGPVIQNSNTRNALMLTLGFAF
jgi:hypothetical protein